MAHHIIWDGWSFDLFYEEMDALYGGVASAPLPPVTYGDFTAWHRDWMSGPELSRQLEHWRGKLAGAPDTLDLQTDRPRPPIQSGEGATEWLAIPKATAAGLREVGLREGATLFMTLLGAWTAFLHQLSRQSEVIVGTPVRGRALPELETVMGFFVNALPLRLRVDPSASFLELLRHVRAEVVESFGAQDVPFEHLVRVLDTKRDESRFPIYQAFFSYQDARQRPPTWGDLEHHNLPVFQPAAAQDVALWFLDNVDGLVGGLNYNTDIFEAGTAAGWRRRFLALTEAIAADPERSIRELLAVTPEERRQLVALERNHQAAGRGCDAAVAVRAARRARPGDRGSPRRPGGHLSQISRRSATHRRRAGRTRRRTWRRRRAAGRALAVHARRGARHDRVGRDLPAPGSDVPGVAAAVHARRRARHRRHHRRRRRDRDRFRKDPASRRDRRRAGASAGRAGPTTRPT